MSYLRSWKMLLYRLGIIMLAYTIIRFAFIFYNYSSFPTLDIINLFSVFASGLIFDISAILYINIIIIILHILPIKGRANIQYQKSLKFLFYLFNVPFIFLSIADIGYYTYTYRRSTIEILGFSNDAIDVAESILLGFWILSVLLIGLLVLIEFLYRKTNEKPVITNWKVELALWIPIAALVVIGMRGGVGYRPISPISAAYFVGSELAILANNTSFELLHSFGKPSLNPKEYYTQEEAESYFKFCRQFKQPLMLNGNEINKGKGDNIVVIILESNSPEYMGCYGFESYTPFLDSIAKKGLLFENMFSNGLRSIDGIPSIGSSLPYFMDENFIYSQYQTNNIEGIGSVLNNMGYQTAFFHGATNGSFNFDVYADKAGFSEYYGRTEYNNETDFDGTWGIYDFPFFKYTCNTINQFQKPFGIVLYSISSHHPCDLPDYFDKEFAHIKDPFLRAIRYTDYSLEHFFNLASKQDWYDSTLFLITSDHNGLIYNDEFYSRMGLHRIPLLVYHPGRKEISGRVKYPVQQADIMPTIAHYVDYDKPLCTIGNSVLTDEPHYVVNYHNKQFAIADSNHLVLLDENNNILFNYEKDIWLKHPINNQPVKDKLEQELKSRIQTYQYRMQQNKLTERQIQ